MSLENLKTTKNVPTVSDQNQINEVSINIQNLLKKSANNKYKDNGQVSIKKNYENLIQKLVQLKRQVQDSYTQLKINNPQDMTLDSISSKSQSIQNIKLSQIQDFQYTKLQQIRKNIIGLNSTYKSPFNIQLQAIYVDHTATNRPYYTIQKVIENAKRFQANPHTQFNHYGKYSTQMMKYAQKSLLQTFEASKNIYVALPTGNGATGAIQKAIKALRSFQQQNMNTKVFLSPYEHHSNILPWVQYYGDIQILENEQNGVLKNQQIQDQLLRCESDNIIISVSAASNITSQITDLQQLNAIIKKIRKSKQIVFCIDCAAYCCHNQLNLLKLDEVDFAFLSPHKNLGGVQACGVLIAKKSFFQKSSKPTYPGGGTVAFVHGYTNKQISYHKNVFDRQIAGTPPFLAFYRAALSFQLLKSQIGYNFIHSQQVKNTQIFINQIQKINQQFQSKKQNKRIKLYGLQNLQKRANVVTFNIFQEQSSLHYNLTSLALADIFGIQIRSGCFCSGPFGMRLLKISQNKAIEIKKKVTNGDKKQKPGYLRLDLPFYFLKNEVEYLAAALKLISKYSTKISKLYQVKNNGQIMRKGYQNTKYQGYQLSKWKLAQIEVQKMSKKNIDKLEMRQQTLAIQLKRAELFLMSQKF